MVWQMAGRVPSARRGMTPGSSSNGDSPVSRASKAGSRRRSTASAQPLGIRVARAPRLPQRNPPGWHGCASRDEWNDPPSDSSTRESPYQLRSSTVASGASRSSESWRPRARRARVHDEVVVAVRVGAQAALGSARSRHRDARPPAARVGSTSTRVTRQPGIATSRRATQHPTMPAPTTATRSPMRGGGVPERVDGRLDGAGEHGPPSRARRRARRPPASTGTT